MKRAEQLPPPPGAARETGEASSAATGEGTRSGEAPAGDALTGEALTGEVLTGEVLTGEVLTGEIAAVLYRAAEGSFAVVRVAIEPRTPEAGRIEAPLEVPPSEVLQGALAFGGRTGESGDGTEPLPETTKARGAVTATADAGAAGARGGARRGAIAVGALAALRPGERVRLLGEWVDDPARGRQFRVREYLSLLPATLAGLERFLASGFVPGVGSGLAHRLVETFGLELFRALDEGDPAIAGLRGMGEGRAQRLLEAWRREKTGREALVYLESCGLSPAQAERVYRRFGEHTVDTVRRDPYRLAEDIRGIGFQRADEIARQLGIERDSITRARAALRYLLNRAVEDGHVYLPLRRILTMAEPLELSPANVLRALVELEAAGELIGEELSGEDGGADRAIYRPDLYRAERTVAALLSARAAREPASTPWRSEEALAAVETRLGIRLASRQREAVLAALSCPLLTITGGPGTGKTTLVRAILELFAETGTRFELAAPTGRAARRLQEATGVEARTLHRLLEVQPPGMSFRRSAENPIEAGVVLVDEASMIDLPLFAGLLSALRPETRLILVGDVHQLPPVGPGNVLEAVIQGAGAKVVMLDEVYRQGSTSLIALNAQRINRGMIPLLPKGADAKEADFFFLEEERTEEALALIVDLVQRRLPARYGFDPRAEIQVLAPSHKGPLGVGALNERLQAALNRSEGDTGRLFGAGAAGREGGGGVSGEGAGLEGGEALPPRRAGRGHRLRIGDKVLQSRNNYDKELFNGDVGFVVGLDRKTLSVQFDTRVVTLTGGEADDLELAYAMTVHKAQGSEFPAVVMPIVESHTVMLRRNLVYTAVTRARRLVVLVGSPAALARAVRREAGDRRYSRLAARLVFQG